MIIKQSDVFTIIISASVGMVAAFIIGNMVFGDPNMEKVTYKDVEKISTNIVEPDPELFNAYAINPTVEVEVGVCEDTNGNGILDQDERNRCLGIVDESTDKSEQDTDSDSDKKADSGSDSDTKLKTNASSSTTTTIETTTETIEEVVKDGSAN